LDAKPLQILIILTILTNWSRCGFTVPTNQPSASRGRINPTRQSNPGLKNPAPNVWQKANYILEMVLVSLQVKYAFRSMLQAGQKIGE